MHHFPCEVYGVWSERQHRLHPRINAKEPPDRKYCKMATPVAARDSSTVCLLPMLPEARYIVNISTSVAQQPQDQQGEKLAEVS